MAKNAFKDGKTVHHNKKAGGKQTKVTDDKYAKAKFVDSTESKKLSDVRQKFAKNADKATTASAKKGKDLPKAVQEVDSEGNAQVLPQLYQQAQQMMGILGMGSGLLAGGGGNSGDSGYVPLIPSGISYVLQDSFTGAIAILVRKYGFERVVSIFITIFTNNSIKWIDARLQPLVLNSVANLIKLSLYFGMCPKCIPVSEYDETIYGDTVPSPLVDVTAVPDLYVKQYYSSISANPYPGYTKWLSKDGTTAVYTKDAPKALVFASVSEEVYSISEREIAAELDPYFPENKTVTLTAPLLNLILLQQITNIENNSMNLGMGNNSGGGGGGNMAGMLAGALQMLIQLLMQQMQEQESPLKEGSMQQTLQQFTQDMGMNNQIFELGKTALGGGMGGLGSLGGMGGLSNIMSGFGMGGGGISGILGNMGIGDLMGGFGGFGGSSGGGGGGAGSGFPTATPGDYSGGDLTETGLADIRRLLTLLGIEDT